MHSSWTPSSACPRAWRLCWACTCSPSPPPSSCPSILLKKHQLLLGPLLLGQLLWEVLLLLVPRNQRRLSFFGMCLSVLGWYVTSTLIPASAMMMVSVVCLPLVFGSQ